MLRTFFHNGTKTHRIVKGKRECVLRKLDDNEYLLSVYKDDLKGDCVLERGNKTNKLVPFYLLNQSAAIVWYFLKDCLAPENLLDSLKEYYPDSDRQEIAKDLDEFLKRLYQFHLISLSEDSGAKNNTAVFSSYGDDVEIKQMVKGRKKKYSYFCIEPLAMNEHVFTQGGVSWCLEPPNEQP